MVPEDDYLIDSVEVALLLGLPHPQGLAAYRSRFDDLPSPVALMVGRVLWRGVDVERWAQRHYEDFAEASPQRDLPPHDESDPWISVVPHLRALGQDVLPVLRMVNEGVIAALRRSNGLWLRARSLELAMSLAGDSTPR
jgi:predicted DNA-binding transcriptional regulator AlpA